MNDPWRCGVCDGVNDGGGTCAICGAPRSRAAATVEQPPPSRQREGSGATDEPAARAEPAPWDEPAEADEPAAWGAAPATEPERWDEPAPWDEPAAWDERAAWDEPAPAPRRGLFGRVVDAAAGAVQRALTVPAEEAEPPDERRRSRLKVRPFPFGLMVTWRSGDPPDPDAPSDDRR